MNSSISLRGQGPIHWISMEESARSHAILNCCTVSALQDSVAHLDGVRVVSATVNRSGQYREPLDGAMPANINAITADRAEVANDAAVEKELPDFCDVRLEQTVGGHVVRTTVWVPLEWNGRFFGLGGQGNRTSTPWIYPEVVRIATLPRVLRNGFAGAETDGGNRDSRFADWGLDVETRELDWELIRNWAHRSTHDMTIIGKAVTTAIHGKEPRYSYFQGTSGGGRQAMMQAQRYPLDYDGVWSADPAINWARKALTGLWPAVVMKDHNNALPPAKLHAFRTAFLKSCGAEAARDGFVSAFEAPFWDPRELVGAHTEAGEITATDATVMQKIWEGPRRPDGEFLWFGTRPGAESWGDNIYGVGTMVTVEQDGKLSPVPFELARAYGSWLLRDPDWDWKTLTIENFHEMSDKSVRDFSELDTADPDLSGLRDAGGKLLLTHGLDDEVIPSAGTLHYFRRVVEAMGGVESTSQFARMFLSPGDGHSHVTGAGPGITLSAGMIALMDWVENGRSPDAIVAEKYDLKTGTVTMSRPVCAYPKMARYVGEGDYRAAANFTCVDTRDKMLQGDP